MMRSIIYLLLCCSTCVVAQPGKNVGIDSSSWRGQVNLNWKNGVSTARGGLLDNNRNLIVSDTRLLNGCVFNIVFAEGATLDHSNSNLVQAAHATLKNTNSSTITGADNDIVNCNYCNVMCDGCDVGSSTKVIESVEVRGFGNNVTGSFSIVDGNNITSTGDYVTAYGGNYTAPTEPGFYIGWNGTILYSLPYNTSTAKQSPIRIPEIKQTEVRQAFAIYDESGRWLKNQILILRPIK